MTDSGLKAVYLARRSLIERLVRARTNSSDETQDVMQELWLRLDQAKPGPINDPVAYLLRTAMNLIIDRSVSIQRRREREHAWSTVQPRSAEMPNQEARLIASDELENVHGLFEQMPEVMVQALIMFRLEGQSQKTIAAKLGMSVSGVEKLLARAYRLLAEFQKNGRVRDPAQTAEQLARSTPDAR